MFGHNFHNLPDMTKEEFLEECAKPFTNPWDGRKMFVKSHWFAYNLQWLQENFPEANFAFCYSPMPEAFKWWHLCGGWNITYPDYSWYGTDERMIEGIMAENALIKDFITKNNLKFDHNESFEGFYSELGFEQPEWLRSKYHPEVGLESISPEQFREDIETVLKPGMVVSMEPMIFIPEGEPGAGGYREHDILVINENGAEDITKFPFGPEHNIIK